MYIAVQLKGKTSKKKLLKIQQPTPRIPFMSDDVAASSAYNLGIFIAAAFWVPLYREFHFYFAHR